MTTQSAEHLSALRNLPLHDVAAALGYQRAKDDRSKWKKTDSILSINHTQFYDHLRQVGGGGAIDLVLHAKGCSFAAAVRFLQSLSPSVQSHLCESSNWLTVQHYLCCQRGLDIDVIETYRHPDIITADRRNNAVFCMRNANAQRIGAEIVGTNTTYRFRGLAKGSKRQNGGFWITQPQHLDPKQCQSVLLVESAIDALSVLSLSIPELPPMIISTAGLVYALPRWFNALNLQQIVCGYDADAPAQLAFESLKSDPRVMRLQPQGAKDWNELLQKTH